MMRLPVLFSLLIFSATQWLGATAQCSGLNSCSDGSGDCCSQFQHGSVSDQCCSSGACSRMNLVTNCLTCGTVCTGNSPACCTQATVPGCKDLYRDDQNCLACQTPCLAGEHCCPVDGVQGCHAINYTTDALNCGGCQRACLNDAICSGGVCVCPPGYSGATCATDINECASNPCRNGATCVDILNGFSCSCATGYTGARCQTNIDECSPNPCQNSGVCTDGVGSFTCTCSGGFSGNICQNFPPQCPTSQCQNGATCIEGLGSYTCACAAGYTGTLCQTEINECSSSPCRNGGSCSDAVNGFSCSCAPGYSGLICQTDVNECSSSPCRNGAVCIDQANGFSCSCTSPYTGRLCEVDPRVTATWPGVFGHCMMTVRSGPDLGVYVLTGRNSSGYTAEVWKSVAEPFTSYHPVANVAPFRKRVNAACTVMTPVNGTSVMVLTGGVDETGNPISDVWTSTNGTVWIPRTLSPPWAARGFHGVASNGTALFLFGGRRSAGSDVTYGDAWISLDTGVNWSRLGSGNHAWGPRDAFGYGFWNGRIWLVNGRNNTFSTPTLYSDVWSSVDGSTWSKEYASGVPSHRFGALLVPVEGEGMFLFAGTTMNGGEGLNDYYQTKDGINWCRVQSNSGPFDIPRVWLGGTAVNGTVYVSGGLNRPTLDYSRSVLAFRLPLNCTLAEKQWQSLPAAAWGVRCGHAVVFARGRYYLIGGANGTTCHFSTVQNDVWSTADMRNWRYDGVATPMPGLRDHGAVFHEALGAIVVCGGLNAANAASSACYSWNFVSWSLLTSNLIPTGTGLSLFGFSTDGTTMFLVGGLLGNTNLPSPYTLSWGSPYGSAFAFRSNSTWNGTSIGYYALRSVWWRDRVWSFGGLGSDGAWSKLIIAPSTTELSTTSTGYRTYDSGIAERSAHCLNEMGNSSLFIFGGRSVAQTNGFADSYTSSDGFTWHRGPNVPVPLRFSSVAAVLNGRSRMACASSAPQYPSGEKEIFVTGGLDTALGLATGESFVFGENACLSWPCLNGGSCTRFNESFVCACIPGFSGDTCQVNVNECASAPCQVGQACVDQVNGYTCVLDRCSSQPCANGGTCVDGLGGYTCTCASGYSGTLCQTEVDECASSPCLNNGTCVDGVGSFTCVCPPGNLLPFCSCPPGFDGEGCSVNIDECASQPCFNGGTCVDGNNSFACDCPTEYPGPLCNPVVLPCDSRSEALRLCGPYGNMCFKRCETPSGPCPSVHNCTCQAGHGFNFTSSTCGFDVAVDKCTANQGGGGPQTTTCGPFAVSARRICPSNVTIDLSLCHENCTCRTGYGRTPGSSLDCDGQDTDCDPSEVETFCGRGHTSCRKRCQFEYPYTYTTKCYLMPGSCFSASTYHNCSGEEWAACGPATKNCVARYLSGSKASVACTCTDSGFQLGSIPCAEWSEWDFSDTDPSYSLNPLSCYQQCGPSRLSSGRSKPGYQYTHVPDDGERGLRGHYNCAKRRYWTPTLLDGALSLTTSGNLGYDSSIINGGSEDLRFQWLVRNNLVFWNGTGWSDNMIAVRAYTMTTPFWLRHCDCHGPLPVSGTMILNTERAVVFSTYAKVTTVTASSALLLVDACRSLYYNYRTSDNRIASVRAAAFDTMGQSSRNPESNEACSGRGKLQLPTALVPYNTLANTVQTGSGFATIPSVTDVGGVSTICQRGTAGFSSSLGDVLRATGFVKLNPGFSVAMWISLPANGASNVATNLLQIDPGVVGKNPFVVQTYNGKLRLMFQNLADSCVIDTVIADPTRARWRFVVITVDIFGSASQVDVQLYLDNMQGSRFLDGCVLTSGGATAYTSGEVRVGPAQAYVSKFWFYGKRFTESEAQLFYLNGPPADVSPRLFFRFETQWSSPASTGDFVSSNEGTDVMGNMQVFSGNPLFVYTTCLNITAGEPYCECLSAWSGSSCDIQNCRTWGSSSESYSGCGILWSASLVSSFWLPGLAVDSSRTCNMGEHCSEVALRALGRSFICGSYGHLQQTIMFADYAGYTCSCDLGIPNGVTCGSQGPCSGRGVSVRIGGSGAYQCVCINGWAGSDCQLYNECPALLVPSASHVTSCDYSVYPSRWICATSGRGTWSGSQCATWTPNSPCLPSSTSNALFIPVITTRDPSSNSGAPVVESYDTAQCLCKSNSTSFDCSVPSCPISNGMVCGGRGSCISGRCVCDRPYSWDGCSCSLSRTQYCTSSGTSCDVSNEESGCLICGNRGTCAISYNASAVQLACQCTETGAIGQYCQQSACPGNGCNFPRGTCVVPQYGGLDAAYCVCNGASLEGACTSESTSLYAGSGCEVNVCDQCGTTPAAIGQARILCNREGSCDLTNGTYACNCTGGYSGDKCTNSPCSPQCIGNTYCTTQASCACLRGYGGLPSTGCTTNFCDLSGLNRAYPVADSGSSGGYYCLCANSSLGNSTCKDSGTTTCCTDLKCPVDGGGYTCGYNYGLVVARAIPSCGSGGSCNCGYGFTKVPETGLCIPYCSPNNSVISALTFPCITSGLGASIACTGCSCKMGYSTSSRCYSSLCLNGGTVQLTATGFRCLCAPGWSLPYCAEADCSGNGVRDELGNCVCRAPYTGATCSVHLCTNGGSPNSTAAACSCPVAWSGAYCNTTLCQSGSTPSTDGSRCICDRFHTGTFCESEACENGATFNATASTPCVCTDQWSGDLCQFPRCGTQGSYNLTRGDCQCLPSSVLQFDPATRNCTRSLCGPFGSPSSNVSSCECFIGASLVLNHSDPSGYLCVPGCGTGEFNRTSWSCACPPGTAQPYCAALTEQHSSSAAASSTGRGPSSSSTGIFASGSSTAASQASSTAVAPTHISEDEIGPSSAGATSLVAVGTIAVSAASAYSLLFSIVNLFLA